MAEVYRETIRRAVNGVCPGVYAWFTDPKEAAEAALPRTPVQQTSPSHHGSDGLWRALVDTFEPHR